MKNFPDPTDDDRRWLANATSKLSTSRPPPKVDPTRYRAVIGRVASILQGNDGSGASDEARRAFRAALAAAPKASIGSEAFVACRERALAAFDAAVETGK